jgi:hypothetical protein
MVVGRAAVMVCGCAFARTAQIPWLGLKHAAVVCAPAELFRNPHYQMTKVKFDARSFVWDCMGEME